MASFEAKSMGRKMFAVMAGLVVLVSCGLEEMGAEKNNEEDIWIGPGSVVTGNDGKPGIGKKVWYAVGVDYPQDYDWRMDNQKGSVRCSLVVFANGISMMKVPAGDQYEICSDPDMHRMIGGSLYTDYSADTETVIKRNGEPQFRYSGRERIIDMAVENGRVYTLGQDRDGDGFAFRVDGQVLLERSRGYVFQHLQRTEDGYSFSFCETIGSGEDAKERYYHYLAGEVCQVAVREDIKKVWDIIFLDDKVCYLASMVGISDPVLAVGSDLAPLTVPDNATVKSCRFVPGTAELDIEGVIYQRRKRIHSGIWKGTSLVKVFPSGYTVAAICPCNGGLSCVLNAPGSSAKGIIYRCGQELELPEDYMSMGGHSLVMVDGLLYVGLTSETSDGAAVWVEDEMKPLKINGFISHMSMY